MQKGEFQKAFGAMRTDGAFYDSKRIAALPRFIAIRPSADLVPTR
jgi:hypothetical protein